MSTENLKTVSGAQLLELNLPPTKFIVKGLIPQGFHILAGQPKIGKSWLLLHLCLQVSKGEPFWNYETSKGTVLYLCLEDSYNRIQTRLTELTENSYFYAATITDSSVIKEKLLEELNPQGAFTNEPFLIIFRLTVLLHLCQHT